MGLASTALKLTRKIPFIYKRINRIATNRQAKTVDPRPNPYSLWSHQQSKNGSAAPVNDYVSWPSLTDNRFSSRHLPPFKMDNLPPDAPYDPSNKVIGDVTALFDRKDSMKKSRSSLLFMFFAQWFTDSLLRTDFTDRRKNTSNHNIDLCQIYGLTEQEARVLRSGSGGNYQVRIHLMGNFLNILEQE